METKETIALSELNVFCSLGLNNRLMVMSSGYVIAKKVNCAFSMTWIKTPDCGCEFSDIFKVNPLLHIRNEKDSDFIYHDGKSALNIKNNQIINTCTWTWLNCPDVFSRGELIKRSIKMIGELQPIDYIANEVSLFKKKFFKDKEILGVHIRRGDFLITKKQRIVDLEKFILEIKKRMHENMLIFIATDDGAASPDGVATEKEDVINKLNDEFNGKVIFYPVRSLDRGSRESTQDGFITSLLLQECSYFIGTTGSSFSNLIAMNKNGKSILL